MRPSDEIQKEIQKEIIRLSRENEDQDIVSYIKKQLQSKSANIQDIFEFVENECFTEEPGKPHVINPTTINQLGLMLVSQEDIALKNYAAQFFKLSAEREDYMGCKKYAYCLLYEKHGAKKSPKDAVKYAEKAVNTVESMKEKPSVRRQDSLKRLFLHALLADQQREKASEVLINHLSFLKEKEDTGDKINATFKILDNIIDELDNDFTKENVSTLSEEKCQNRLKELKQLLKLDDHNEKKQRLYYFKGKYHEHLREDPEAWQAFCKVDLKKSPIYKVAVKSRAELLKRYIGEQLNIEGDAIRQLSSSLSNTSINEEKFHTSESPKIDSTDSSSDNEDKSPKRKPKYKRHAAERHFFNPSRSKKKRELLSLTRKIIDQRFSTSEGKNENTPIQLEDISTRRLITAERLFQEAVISLNGEDSDSTTTNYAKKTNLGTPYFYTKTFTNNTSYKNEEKHYGPTEYYRTKKSTIEVKHEYLPSRSRLGHCFVENLGRYSNRNNDATTIIGFLNMITGENTEKEQKIAKLIIQYGKTQTVTLEDLQGIWAKAHKEILDKFIRICCLMTAKEQGQWHLTRYTELHIGMSVSQARALILIEAGFLRFKDIFPDKNCMHSEYGVYSHTGMVGYRLNIEKHCSNIDKKYLVFLKQNDNPEYRDFARLFKLQSTSDGTPQTAALTPEQAHCELQYVYGGSSDTDGDEYDSDLSFD